ncbi:SusC/RagA family TonB-linked outer membrane protein [Mucilaginibacter myungsuensis]|uniref:TonB-dependent receptor n=1 Tax=Mucilaginibacter myungsuensis TaxID=649104 RepID=A0A929PXA5_9SPHI|nr:TonB-dependent receptor [Mucilaginibacter myungsuensis]MBE9662032.1 TonB-dependent receptor [Mucilaginibacter myungsuensis]MDN3599535.1 TonB-dependent receptor [Mucilaginibacter myungsuensis]
MKKNLLSKIKVIAYASSALLCVSVLPAQATTIPNPDGLPYLVGQQETGTISGKVVDEKGETLPGATIMIKELNKAVSSNADGTFKISVAAGTYNVTVTYVSYATLTLSKIVVKANEVTPLNIALKAESGTLNELIIVGYGTQKRANATGAVDQIRSKNLENRPVTNLTQGLQGQIPNLNLRMLDGKPTQSPTYNVRGTTSIGQGGSALILIDGFEGDPSLLNPNDVESVSVLKDAGSAAIYGARGVFGVVLITTKKGEKGRTSVTYTNNYAIKSPIVRPEVVTDGYTWAKMFAEAFVNGDGAFPQNANKTQKFSQAYLDEFKRRVESGQPYNQVEVNPTTGEYTYYGSEDYYAALYKNTTQSFENNLSVSGGSEKVNFLVSGRMLDQKGLFRYNSDDYTMKNLRARGSVQIAPWLSIENNADYSIMNYHNPLNVGEGGGIWRNIADEGKPTVPLTNPDGSLTFASAYTVGDLMYGKNGFDTQREVFRNITGLRSNFFNNKFRVNADFTFRNTDNDREQKRVQVPYSSFKGVTAFVGTTTNDLSFDLRETRYLATNIYSEFEDRFGKDHYFKAMAGYNYEQSTYNRTAVQRNGIIFEDATDLNLALGQAITTGGGYEQWAILGGFSRLNYSYKDRYLVEVNARYDGSSKFPSNQRYGFFPSVSAGWRVNNEPFWKVSDKLISDLKLRASYGSLGNGNIASYAFQEQFNISQSGVILNGSRPQTTRNPSVLPDGLTWETATTTNVGLDLTMLSGKLSLTGDAYVRKTTDMFTTGLTPPAVFGAGTPRGNYADLTTRGWELSVSWNDRIGSGSKPFVYNVRVTLADNITKIDKYNNPDKLLSDYYEGQTLGEIWGYETEGFFIDAADIESHAKQDPQMRASPTGLWFPGDIKLRDLNGDGFINVGENKVGRSGDRRIIGNSAPRYTYGINLGASWHNLFFSSFLQGVGKQQWYPSTETEMFWGQYNRPYNNIPLFHLGNMWTPENTNAYFPRTMSRAASSNTNRTLGVAQTKYLQNVAYLRLKNIQVGYNLPSKWINRVGMRSAKVFFSGENLFTYSPMYKIVKNTIDVENAVPSDQDLNPGSTNGDGYNYPLLKSYSFGLNIGF